MDIDISGIDKAAVLAALYNGSRPQGLGFLQFSDTPMTTEQAQAILEEGVIYFDYLKGRVMKVNLEGDSFNPWAYDRDNGEGAAFTVIRALRESGDITDDDIDRLHKHGTANAANDLLSRYGDEAVELAKKAAKPYAC